MSPEFQKIVATIIEETRNHLGQLTRQQSVLDRQIEDFKREMVFIENFLEKFEVYIPPRNNGEGKGNKSLDSELLVNGNSRNNGEVRVGDLAYKMILKRQTPISVGELWDQLQLFGKAVKREGIPSILKRDSRFKRVGRGFYTLKT